MELPLQAGTLAQDCYPASAQAFYDEMFERGAAIGPDITGLLIQDAAPDPVDRGHKGWIPTSGGVPIYPGYVFIWHPVVGHWVSRHQIAASDASRRIYVGTSASVQTYDGGDANAPGIASGAMWQIDTAFDGRTPVGVGLIPTSSPAATIVNPLDTQDSLGNSGEYKHTLTTAEGAVGTHTHPFGFGDTGTGDIGLSYVTPAVTTPAYNAFGNTGGGPIGLPTTQANLITLAAGDGSGSTSAGHNTMQPYIGVYFLKRTIRQFFIAG